MPQYRAHICDDRTTIVFGLSSLNRVACIGHYDGEHQKTYEARHCVHFVIHRHIDAHANEPTTRLYILIISCYVRTLKLLRVLKWLCISIQRIIGVFIINFYNPIAGVGGKPVIWGGGTVLLIGAVCNGRRGCFCDAFTNGSIVSDKITF